MRITLETILQGDFQVTIDPTEDKKFFLELLLPAYRGDVLGEHEDPYPRLHSDLKPSPPKAAKLRNEKGWLVTYDCTNVIAAEYKAKFPTYTLGWYLIQFGDLKITIKGPTSVVVFKIPPPPGVTVDPETHQVQI